MASVNVITCDFKKLSVNEKKEQIPKAPVPVYLFNLRQMLNRKKPNAEGLLKAKYELTCRLLWPTQKVSASESKATIPKVIIYKYQLQRKMNESARALKKKMDSTKERKMKKLQKYLISG